jgi:hypothetical protein
MGEKFLELLRESVIVQGLIALILVSAAVYLLIVGRAVPNWLLDLVFFIVGFYLGGKSVVTMRSRANAP